MSSQTFLPRENYFPRSFYIRFAKITLPFWLYPPESDYNVYRYQAFSRSTLMIDLASHM